MLYKNYKITRNRTQNPYRVIGEYQRGFKVGRLTANRI